MTHSLLLTAEELQRIRARLESDDFDYLDVAALFDHIDAITGSYEAMVTRTAEHNNQAQAVLSAKEGEILMLRESITSDLTELREAWNHYGDIASSTAGHLDGCPAAKKAYGPCEDQACGLTRLEDAIKEVIGHLPAGAVAP